ncbi:uncharacterized protein TNIN_176421 [Trichonephila inaurata madagascariensis]|uniref:DUF7041 domain-containing protein n=1 Tax=Trichonephila inaurata madagascariensis TaxID=2747483 RepID=A0A8X6WYB1_9ARAC|nr:uncharacterized protein TNIN_176421 [Trichonephila inaurata madagascariensis]
MKFHYIVANLDSRYAAEVDDIITNPSTTGMYEKLKNQLINRLSLSKEQRVQKLLGHEELGDRQSTLEPDQMADMADRIMEVPLLTSMPSVNSIDPIVASEFSSISVTLESLVERVEDLAKQPVTATTGYHIGSSHLLVTNQLSKKQFLVDTGLDLCVFPCSFLSPQKPDPNFRLKAANNSTIKTFGFLTLPLDLGLRRHFFW